METNTDIGAQRLKDWLKAERGRISLVARACNRSHSAVIKWDGRVPAELVLTVEQMTGIPRFELRSDVFGKAA